MVNLPSSNWPQIIRVYRSTTLYFFWYNNNNKYLYSAFFEVTQIA